VAVVFRRIIGLLFVLALAGCAAEMAFRDGQQLIAQENVEAGLSKFREAMTADPSNAQYRMSYLRARDAAVLQHLELAETKTAEGKSDAAAAIFMQALALEPANERARAGLAAIQIHARHERQLAEAEAALARKDLDGARLALTSIVAERPTHERARAMLRSLAEKSVERANPETGLNRLFKKPISIQFKDASLRQIFEVIARSSGLNFIFDKDVKVDQKASIFLKDSTIELAVYYLLVTNQLERQVIGDNTVLVYPNTPAKVKEYQELVVKTFFVANADAKVIANSLKTILKSRDIVVDEKLNLVILRDSREAIRLAEKLVSLQDIAEPEVMLEVEILEVKRSRLLDLGVTWPSGISLTPLTTTSGAGLTLADLRNLDESRIGITSPTLTLAANKKDGDTNILANPRIRVRNREKARVLIGEKAPQITTTISPGTGGFASESVTYVDVGLTLNVEPTIYLNNEVAIKVALEVSNLLGQVQTKSGSVAYQIGTRQASTLLQLKDGENQVLAGLINNEDRSNGNKVPGMGDIPLLGRLFGNTKDDSQKTEIVLSITPHLIRNILRPEASASEFEAGTDGAFRLRPDPAPRSEILAPKPAIVNPIGLPASVQTQ
jgi:general secretion pathway protein D